MKLNLGCGARHVEGYVNVDLESNWSTKKPDVAADISKPLPFESGVADEVRGIHIFEHFYRYEADEILTDWVRVLKPGGLLVLELPCLDKVFSIMQHSIKNKMAMPENLTLWGLYGDPKYSDPAMVHRWCYSQAELTGMMQDRGLTVESTKATTHQPIRDMRLEGRKWH